MSQKIYYPKDQIEPVEPARTYAPCAPVASSSSFGWKDAPYTPVASSISLGWKGLQAHRFQDLPSGVVYRDPSPLHTIILINRPPEKLNQRYEGLRQDLRPLPGSISMLPNDSFAEWSWRGTKDSLHVFLEPDLFARVAGSFELDLARLEIPPSLNRTIPALRSAMLAINAELTTGGVGGPLMVESLANVLSVHLIRYILGSRQLKARKESVLPRRKLNTVIEYIMENLESSLTMEQMAAVTHLSIYHFARQFKTTTGLPPHQYVIARRVERARQILREDDEISLAQVALRVGFSDQSQFHFHFKRIVGVTPRQFQMSARIA